MQAIQHKTISHTFTVGFAFLTVSCYDFNEQRRKEYNMYFFLISKIVWNEKKMKIV